MLYNLYILFNFRSENNVFYFIVDCILIHYDTICIIRIDFANISFGLHKYYIIPT